ncbi:hypothetical protein BDV35DRAFT_353462 [Aspergillus flavus]|uniref:Uncharacterized protein n=1 Tax=Aspergillus flavus TaxID=5059 RepID=A0A5N6GWI5_ASPFL|nr:hypothetical protein BDV35DRAFT_353462 [Aspergillus flavus]
MPKPTLPSVRSTKIHVQGCLCASQMVRDGTLSWLCGHLSIVHWPLIQFSFLFFFSLYLPFFPRISFLLVLLF